jgi:hypothetical protein
MINKSMSEFLLIQINSLITKSISVNVQFGIVTSLEDSKLYPFLSLAIL